MHILPISLLFFGIVGAFFFAGVETGYISWNSVKVRYKVSRGGFFYKFTPTLLKNRDLVLGTVLLGNNISIVMATLAFAEVWQEFSKISPLNLSLIPSPDLLILTPFLVIFSEILPKSLFRIYSFRLTIRAVPILSFLYYLFFPLTYLLATFSKIVENGQMVDNGKEKRAKVALLAKEANRQGSLSISSKVFVENILELKNITISDINFITNLSYIVEKRDSYIKLSKGMSLLDFISNGLGLKAPYYQVGENVISSFLINSYLFYTDR